MELFQGNFIIVYILFAVLTLGYLYLRKHYSYWANRDIAHDPPKFFFGNLYEVGRSKPKREPFFEFYSKYKNVGPFAGFYMYFSRAAVVFDLDLIKNILISDFANFPRRDTYYNEKDDPLSAHLFHLDGPMWKHLRTKFSWTFTPGKMKFMFPTVVDVAEQLKDAFNRAIDSDGTSSLIEIKEFTTRYTIDVISSCAFGIECNSLKYPDAKFRMMVENFFKERNHGPLIHGLMVYFPNLARKLRMTLLPENMTKFFFKVVRETVAYREQEKVQRNDFMSLLIELKNSEKTDGITIEQLAAQCMLFLAAGFESSSNTLHYALYALALNQDIQEKARKEIMETLKRYDGKFTYEGLHELKYSKQILHETMRLWSFASCLTRVAKDDYQIPGTNYIIEKNVTVVVPVDSIHRDPEIFPNPEKFDPSRFEQSEIEKRHPMTWLPFGDGPRNCVGARFGEMQSLIGLATVLKNFKVTCKETAGPIKFDAKCIILVPKPPLILKIEKN